MPVLPYTDYLFFKQVTCTDGRGRAHNLIPDNYQMLVGQRTVSRGNNVVVILGPGLSGKGAYNLPYPHI